MSTEIYKEIEEYFDKCAPLYNNIHIKIPYIDKWQFDNIFSQIDFSCNPTILDLGTGDGNMLVQTGIRNPSCNLIGLDLSGKMLKEAEKNLKARGFNGKFIQSNMENISLKNESVDYVISNGAIHHVKDKQSLYTEVLRILKTGGKLIVCDGFDNNDEKYTKLQNEIKENDPLFRKGFIEDFDNFQKFLKENVPADLADHPQEFHITPFETKALLEKIGYTSVTIIPSPKQYLIYSGQRK